VVLQRRRRNLPTGIPSVIEGTTPDGSLARVDLSTGRRELLFLTSSCKPCQAVWASLSETSRGIVVTPSTATESRRNVSALAPPGVLVVMSSDAWFAFAPGPAPWRVVLLDGEVTSSASAAG
jgi:hypothetical protein